VLEEGGQRDVKVLRCMLAAPGAPLCACLGTNGVISAYVTQAASPVECQPKLSSR